METKKSIVRTAIFKKAFSGKNGLAYIFDITFDNQDTGQYFSNSEKQDVFQEGKEIEYTIEQKTNGNYTNYSIRPVKSGNGFVPGKGNPAYEHKRVALRCACDLVCAGKIDEKNLIPAAEKLMTFLNG